MSYCCIQIVYGLSIPTNRANRGNIEMPDESIADAFECDLEGFIAPYSSSGDGAYAFGIELDDFDECQSTLDISSLTLDPTSDHLKKYQDLFNAQTPEVQAALTALGQQPRVMFVFGSS